MLKASARNCKVNRSLTLVFLKSEKSTSRKFGPVKVLRPRLPLKGVKPGVVLGIVQPGTVAAPPAPQKNWAAVKLRFGWSGSKAALLVFDAWLPMAGALGRSFE